MNTEQEAHLYIARARGSFGGRSYSSSKSTYSGGSTSTKSTAPSKPRLGTSTAKPGSKVTVNGKTIQTSSKKPTKSNFSDTKGVVGDNGYQPKFVNGYSAPAGSVVYYRDNSFTDYFFLYYIFNSDNPARPENQEAIIVQPDGKEVAARPVAGGTDGMMIFNWFIFVLFIIAIIGGIVWGVNKLTSKPKTRERYGY